MTELEKEFGFEYPEFYKKLSEDGMLDWGIDLLRENPNQWEKEIAPRLLENPPFLFMPLLKIRDFGQNVELLSLTEIRELLENPPWPDHYQFVPFVKETGPVYYAFYYQPHQGEDIPIAFLYPDVTVGELVAKNLEDFMFRQLLQYAVYVPKGVDQDQYQKAINKMLESHENYLTLERFTKLQSIFKKPIAEHKYTGEGFFMKLSNLIFGTRSYLGMISWEEFEAEIGLESDERFRV